jgi:ribonuclease HI
MLFPPALGFNNILPGGVNRFIRSTNRRQFLIYTDGSCLENGRANPVGGCAFVFNNRPDGQAGLTLEHEGPFGDSHIPSSNRAELRAVIAALRYRYWVEDGFNSLVIATDSAYVVHGITEWVIVWLRNGWRTSSNVPVRNRDLWECLLGEIEAWRDEGLEVQFWGISRAWNVDADALAREAARGVPQGEFFDVQTPGLFV